MANGKSICRRGNKIPVLLAAIVCIGAIPSVTVVSDDAVRRKLYLQRTVSVCRDGDLVFRYGNGFWSPYFRDASLKDKRFSHTGVITFRNRRPWVVHSDAHSLTGVGNVRLERLEDFLSDASDFAFFRLHVPQGMRERIAAVASSYLGRPFDPAFDAEDDSRLYCSELVMHAVNEACGRSVILPTVVNGKTVVAIDDCYRDKLVGKVSLLRGG
ncbi:MAG: hypothetical protein HGA77_09600 [Chlorobiaceae bacterium]|nr:hypothetical protein [Chlorobiaceae bacterium]